MTAPSTASLVLTPTWNANVIDIGHLVAQGESRGWLVSAHGSFDVQGGMGWVSVCVSPQNVPLLNNQAIVEAGRRMAMTVNRPPTAPKLSELLWTPPPGFAPTKAPHSQRALLVVPTPPDPDLLSHNAPRDAWRRICATHDALTSQLTPGSGAAIAYLANLARVAPWILLADPVLRFCRRHFGVAASSTDADVARMACSSPRSRGHPPAPREVDVHLSVFERCQQLRSTGARGMDKVIAGSLGASTKRLNERRKRLSLRTAATPLAPLMFRAGPRAPLLPLLHDLPAADRLWLLLSPWRDGTKGYDRDHALHAGVRNELVSAAADAQYAPIVSAWARDLLRNWRESSETAALLAVLEGDGSRRLRPLFEPQ